MAVLRLRRSLPGSRPSPLARRRVWLAALGTALTALLLAACSPSSNAGSSSGSSAQAGSHAAPTQGGTAIFALPPAVYPTYILPLMSNAYYSNVNLFQFQQLLYRPLYWFGQGGKPVLNERLSLALPPKYSDHNRQVTITLKNYRWSDGKPVTSQDVVFWMHLLKAEKSIWPVYVPGGFPDDVASMTIDSPRQVTFDLTGSYSATWFTYNELSQVTPLPQHAWDKTSSSSPVGAYDATVAGAKSVYAFLSSQAKDTATYTTSPLWKVVDGPWKLAQYQNTGYTVFTPNPAYSGPNKPHLAKLIEQPFTTDAAEFNALKTGEVTYGYIPYQDAAQRSLLNGYRFEPWIGWGINYFPENFNNPQVGPIFRQLYIRQAMQMLINQPAEIHATIKGYGYPTYGPVPIKPANPLATSFEKHNPYPYDPARAMKLLRQHGWDVRPGGVTTCARAGTGANDCGASIPAGARLDFRLQFASGNVFIAQDMEALKSNFSKAGIVVNLSEAPFQTVIAAAAPCKPSQPSCSWQMENWGQGWSYGPDFYPTGGEIFGCGAGINEGSYCSKTNDANITATHRAGAGQAAMARYENYLTTDLPVIWQPEPDFQLSEIKATLHGVLPQSPLLNFTPADWYFTR